MKIDEPKTPYHEKLEDSDDNEENNLKNQNTLKNKGKKIDINKLNEQLVIDLNNLSESSEDEKLKELNKTEEEKSIFIRTKI